MDKTLFAYTAATGAGYPPYVNATRMADGGRLRILARAPAVRGQGTMNWLAEGPTATVMLEPAEAIALAQAILSEYTP